MICMIYIEKSCQGILDNSFFWFFFLNKFGKTCIVLQNVLHLYQDEKEAILLLEILKWKYYEGFNFYQQNQ